MMQCRMLLLASLASLASLSTSSPISSPLQKGTVDSETRDYFSDLTFRATLAPVRAAIEAYHSAGRQVSTATCQNYDLSSARMPTVSGLPAPSEGLTPYHIAIGVGVQNYTCANNTATPTSKGAIATLYNVSCAAAQSKEITTTLAPAAYEAKSLSSGLPPHQNNNPLFNITGYHYFSANSNPDPAAAISPTFNFNLGPQYPNYGLFFAKVDTKAPAAPTLAGQSTSKGGQSAVPWLKLAVPDKPPPGLVLEPSDKRGVKEIFRVNTVGGNANATDCAAHADGKVFSVDYVAEYWFWA